MQELQEVEHPRAQAGAAPERSRRRYGLAGGLGAAVGLAAAFAQAQSAEKPRDVPTFGVETELVYVRFHVERKGGYVDAVKPEQLRVLEDGRPQTIALLETPATRERTIPPEVTLALDVSSSVMDARLLDESLLREVFFTSLSQQATVGLCAFGGQVRCPTPPTRSVEALLDGFQQALAFSHETRGEGTRLYGSLAELCRETRPATKTQRALVVFSDGLDNRGGKVQEAVEAALGSEVKVYAVMLSQAFQEAGAPLRVGGGFSRPPNRAMYDYKKWDLDRLARETNGRAYEPGTLDRDALATILRSIGTEITMENVLGYQPQGAATGRKRRVKVELVDKSLGAIKDGERTLVR
jgi:VWFA-related protein